MTTRRRVALPHYSGSLSGTPVFIDCSEGDAHIPLTRVQESTAVLRSLGGNLTERIYLGMGHTINDDELLGCPWLRRSCKDQHSLEAIRSIHLESVIQTAIQLRPTHVQVSERRVLARSLKNRLYPVRP